MGLRYVWEKWNAPKVITKGNTTINCNMIVSQGLYGTDDIELTIPVHGDSIYNNLDYTNLGNMFSDYINNRNSFPISSAAGYNPATLRQHSWPNMSGLDNYVVLIDSNGEMSNAYKSSYKKK